MSSRVVTYAQNREDLLLAAFFPDDYIGFYVDVGANHPTLDSVTKYFYERGWRGINIEPNEELFNEMVEDRPEDLNLKVGISDKPGKLKLRIYDNGDGLSTFSRHMQQAYEETDGSITKKYHDDIVEVTTLEDVFEKHNVKKIDFLKIDIEGYEHEALKGNNWKKYRPTILCIEANHVHDDWKPLVEKNDYIKVFNDGLNDYYAAKESGHTTENYQYVKGIIGKTIVPEKLDSQLSSQEIEVEDLRTANTRLLNDRREKEDEIERLNVYIFEHTKLRVVLRDLAKAIDNSISLRLIERAKRKKFYPIIKLDKSRQLSAQELYEVVNQSDKKAFNKKPSLGQKLSTDFFTLALLLYRLLKRVLRKLLRQLKNLIKR